MVFLSCHRYNVLLLLSSDSEIDCTYFRVNIKVGNAVLFSGTGQPPSISKWLPESLPETINKTKVNNTIQSGRVRGDQLQGAHHEIGTGNMPWEKFPK